MKARWIDLRRVLYLQLAPDYYPTRDNIVRLQFIDEERRKDRANAGSKSSGTPRHSSDAEFFELRKDWTELAKALFVKGEIWKAEKEVPLLVDLRDTRSMNEKDENGFVKHVVDVPTEAIDEVYIGVDTPGAAVARIRQVVGVGQGHWKLVHTDSQAYRMETTVTSVENRTE